MAVMLEPLMLGRSSCAKNLIHSTNYSQWERNPGSLTITSSISSQGATAIEEPMSCSSVRKLPLITRKQQESPEICILKHQIGVKKASVQAHCAYTQTLFTHNLSLMEDILNMEEKTHSYTNQVLNKYEHFKGTIAKLKLKSSELLSEAQQNLESTRASLHEKIEDLRAKVAEKDVKINKYLRELQVLRHYKENDFPVRMVRIEQMKEQLDGEQISHKGDLEELNQDIVKEKEHHHQKVEADKMQMNAMVIKEHLKNMKKNEEVYVIQNFLMHKELLLHKKTKADLNRDIGELKVSIVELKSSLKRKQQYKKCLPDSEIVLNIPTQRPLPI